ncbi:DUF3810 domain-containing protein [Flavobacterium aciduliphilum]|uniref:Uncharacterized protein DUF3810 n=1 Tax=Flavobacterium aciduliphilum TaxID=1101402 RepID=A0A328YCC7_9FLAO|nr:DUF3810 domain-containing protein [Flavobacterium aciduliphilum]RAR70874.1 uncharacterized protein DUF3810 [Flavobacterium aciduliphilum]
MKGKYTLPLFLIIQIIALRIIALFPELVERFYSNGWYIFISRTSRIILGKVPFSVGDVIYMILTTLLLYNIWKTKKSWNLNWKEYVLKITSYISVTYLLFHLLWGLNYYRMPLFEKMNISRDYTEKDLHIFTEKLIVKTNHIQFQIEHNKNKKVINPYSQEMIFSKSQDGYNQLAKEYPFFKYEISSKKKSLMSIPLTYMGFAGYLNPFTNEAQVNTKLPMVSFPNVMCHEMAHQIGYASESECNFIGFLAGIKNQDLYIQYSAYLNALRYCMTTIGIKNKALFRVLKKKINRGILENYKENDRFWNQYDTFIDKGFHAIYDQYLKMNQQKDGMESYSKFVNLMVIYYKDKKI